MTREQLIVDLGPPISESTMDMGLARAITTLTFKCGCIADDVVAPGNWTRRLGPACTVPAHYR
jgi:hypothetical protein